MLTEAVSPLSSRNARAPTFTRFAMFFFFKQKTAYEIDTQARGRLRAVPARGLVPRGPGRFRPDGPRRRRVHDTVPTRAAVPTRELGIAVWQARRAAPPGLRLVEGGGRDQGADHAGLRGRRCHPAGAHR